MSNNGMEQKMEESTMLQILNRIKICIDRNSLDIARDLVNLEIENLKDLTQKKCKNTRYYYYNWSCWYCSNLNCSCNRSK